MPGRWGCTNLRRDVLQHDDKRNEDNGAQITKWLIRLTLESIKLFRGNSIGTYRPSKASWFVLGWTMTLSARDSLQRTVDAARSPDWSLGVDRTGAVMATRDSGVIGLPWVVKARPRGRGMTVSFYAPGDDSDLEGDVLGELTGNAREMGRQLRHILEDLELIERRNLP